MDKQRDPEIKEKGFPVAVVGLSGRFPGASDARVFWRNLCREHDPVSKIPADRWDWRETYGEGGDGSARSLANSGAFAPFVDRFDAAFFDILPREAQSMDPQQRLFLQTSFAALEDAGLAPKSLAGRAVSVFAGVGFPDYPAQMRLDGAPYDIYRGTGITPTAIANRVSFALDLRGPSETIDTACSGSLIAVHRAIQSLQLGESEIAIAGGVNLLLGPELFVAFGQAGMLSATGQCRTFDAGANGYVRGEGVAALVLRPLADAEANGDFIYGVIRGSAVNHGGKAHSFTAPSIAAQSELVRTAWDKAGLDLGDAALLETHGTGTPLGDPIEVQGLKRALGKRQDTEEKRIALGALKTQIGHLEGAAGVAGVVKALLALNHRLVPANLHFEQRNPKIDLDDTPFFIADKPTPLSDDPETRLLAGVSSFGFGGANAHVVLESYPRTGGDTAETTERPYLIPLSARTKQALIGRVRQLLAYLATGDEEAATQGIPLEDLTTALGLGRLSADVGDIPLRALRVDIQDLGVALRRIGTAHATEIGLEDIRDCVTLNELASRFGEIVHGMGGSKEDEDLLLAQVAIPDALIRNASLAQIVFSLTEGRDAMGERLAVVARSRAELKDRLAQFLSDPGGAFDSIVAGSVRRPAESPAEPPSMVEGQPADEKQLLEWARHWVETRTAKLDWTLLYGEPAPRKIPLPSYPFALTRHWYAKGSRSDTAIGQTASAPPIVTAQPAPVETPASQTPSSPATDRKPITIAAFGETFPSSAVALAFLLDHLASQDGGETVALEGLVFGAPIAVDLHHLKCISVASDGKTTAQCLHLKEAPNVLLQAGIGASRVPLDSPDGPSQPLDRQAFDEAWQAVSHGRGRPVAIQEIASIGNGALRMHLDPATSTGRSAPFWSAIFGALFGGRVLLAKDAIKTPIAAGMPGLYSAQHVGFEPRLKGPLSDILIRRHDDGAFDLIARDPTGTPVLWIDRLTLRPAQHRQTAQQERREEALAS
ncbi:MAG: beta-ketoacyl synthase N-terminal-like domain-containing protein [Methyloligella sp. ZOD6]